MLVLTRKPNQQLTIGKDIVITVVKVRGNTIRLGIEAPRDVRVIRSELEVHVDHQLTADLLLDDEQSAVAEGDTSATISADPIAADGNARSSDVSGDVGNISACHQPLSDIASRAQVLGTIGMGGQSSKSDTGHTSGRSMLGRSGTSGNQAAPLRGFKSTKSPLVKSPNQQSSRNFEDSPLCHRSSLSDRELPARTAAIQAMAPNRSC